MDRAARSGFAMVLVAPLPYVALQLIHANDMLPPTSLIGALWMLLLSALLGYPVVALIGVPVHLFLLKRGWTSLFVYVLTWAAVTSGYYELLVALRVDWNFLQDKAEVGVCGAMSGVLFWLIARPDRPDKSSQAGPRASAPATTDQSPPSDQPKS